MKAARGSNPPAPKPPKEKPYLVVGPRAVHGAEPGSVVKLALSPGREQALIEGGHLEPYKAPTTTTREGAEGDKR